MNDKVINKCVYTSQYKYKTGIFVIIGTVLWLIIILLLFYYGLFIQDTDINNKIAGIFIFITFILVILYTFYWSIKSIILSKKIKNDISNNFKKSIKGNHMILNCLFHYLEQEIDVILFQMLDLFIN